MTFALFLLLGVNAWLFWDNSRLHERLDRLEKDDWRSFMEFNRLLDRVGQIEQQRHNDGK